MDLKRLKAWVMNYDLVVPQKNILINFRTWDWTLEPETEALFKNEDLPDKMVSI